MSKDQLIGYAGRSLVAEALLAADDHLAVCGSCRSALADHTASDYAMAFVRSFETASFSAHLSFEELAGYVDGILDPVAAEIVELHLGDCPGCVEEVESLREVSSPRATPKLTVPGTGFTLGERIRGFFSAPALRLVIPLVLLVGAAAAVYITTQSSGAIDEVQVEVADGPQNSVVPDIVETEPAKTQEPVSISGGPEMAAATIIDGTRELKLDAQGKVIGSFAEEYDLRIAAAIRSGNLPIPAEALRLKGSAGILMGPGGASSGLRVRSPLGKVIATDRPEFKWSRVEGAGSYTVEIFDTNFNKVSTSPPTAGIQWRPSTPLPRGREYTWQVTAVVNGESLRFPTRPSPDAKFMVLSASKLSEIERAKRKYGKSNLVLGILYAEAGLLDDAEREFRSLVRKNPNSNAAKRLLNRIRSAQ